MKKIAVIIALIGIVGLSACKKCSTCTIGNTETKYCSDEYTDTEMSVAETSCRLLNGDWD